MILSSLILLRLRLWWNREGALAVATLAIFALVIAALSV